MLLVVHRQGEYQKLPHAFNFDAQLHNREVGLFPEGDARSKESRKE